LKKALKRAKTLKKSKKKTSSFFCLAAYTPEEIISLIKKGLFYAKFFEFEEFSIVPFFCSSIQPQHTVQWHLI
jgi:hypothetical protein